MEPPSDWLPACHHPSYHSPSSPTRGPAVCPSHRVFIYLRARQFVQGDAVRQHQMLPRPHSSSSPCTYSTRAQPGSAAALVLPAVFPGVPKPAGQPLRGFRDRSSHGGGGQHEQRGPGPHCQPQRSWPRPSAGSHKGRMLHHRRPPSHCRRHGGGKVSGSGPQRLPAAQWGPGCSPSPVPHGCAGDGAAAGQRPAPGTLGSSGSRGTEALGCSEPPACHFCHSLHGSRGCAAATAGAWG